MHYSKIVSTVRVRRKGTGQSVPPPSNSTAGLPLTCMTLPLLTICGCSPVLVLLRHVPAALSNQVCTKPSPLPQNVVNAVVSGSPLLSKPMSCVLLSLLPHLNAVASVSGAQLRKLNAACAPVVQHIVANFFVTNKESVAAVVLVNGLTSSISVSVLNCVISCGCLLLDFQPLSAPSCNPFNNPDAALDVKA